MGVRYLKKGVGRKKGALGRRIVAVAVETKSLVTIRKKKYGVERTALKAPN